MDESELENFVRKIGAGEICWNADKTRAIWVPMHAVRYFEIERMDLG